MFNKKEELIKRLRADPTYRQALKMARNDAERRRIIATAEGFLSTFVDSLTPVAGRIAQDPVFASQLQQALKHGSQVIRESDGRPIVSGSNV